jgi:hypothetical protein
VLLLAWSGILAGKQQKPLPALDEILARLARVSTLYADNALRFTCNETINFSGPGVPLIHKFKYIYRYSGEEQKLVDYRVLRGHKGEMSEEKQERIALENYHLPEYLLRAYSWVFLFDAKVQSLHHYAIEGRDEIFGRPAIRLRFEPVPPVREGYNEWHGTALVDAESLQLLYVEAIRAEEQDQLRLLREAKAEQRGGCDSEYRGSFAWSEFTTEFDVEKHGMRFPGRVVIRRVRHEVRGGAGKGSVREQPLYHVIQTYGRYRFYSVRTAEQITSYVSGEAAGR